MADSVGVSTARRLEVVFETIPDNLHKGLLDRITEFTERLAGRIRSVEPARTGKLRSETVDKIDDYGDRITGRVMIAQNLPSKEYARAAALEYGAHKRMTVTEHQARLDHVFSRRLIAPMQVIVDRHGRTPNIASRRFMRGPTAQIAPDFIDAIRQVAQQATAGEETK